MIQRRRRAGIALACLVVVTKYAFAGHYERESVLEMMRRALEGLWDPPNDDLYEGILGQDVPFLDERLRLHAVGEYANTRRLLSNTPTHTNSRDVTLVAAPSGSPA